MNKMPQTIEAKIPIILHTTPAIAISLPLLFADKATALKTTPTTPKTKLIHDVHENTIDTIQSIIPAIDIPYDPSFVPGWTYPPE